MTHVKTNHSWTIASPSTGEYDPSCLQWTEGEIPPCPDGKVLVRTQLMSIDPTTRNWLKLDPTMMYVPIGIGDTMIGVNVGTVVESRAAGWAAGDLVSGTWGWAEHSVAEPHLIERHERDSGIPDEAYLSVFSHIGRAATMGLLGVGVTQPSDTVVVSGAAGATGTIAVQVAKSLGCRVIAIAGGQDKCRFTVDVLGADDAIDYKSEDVATRLRELVTGGVDVYFDNVGGETLDAVLSHMAIGCRVVVCGAMSQYDLKDPRDAYGVKNLPLLLFRSARIEGFVVPQFMHRVAEFDAVLRRLYGEGRLVARAHVVPGLEQAPEAVRLVLQGRNEGKLMVRVAEG